MHRVEFLTNLSLGFVSIVLAFAFHGTVTMRARRVTQFGAQTWVVISTTLFFIRYISGVPPFVRERNFYLPLNVRIYSHSRPILVTAFLIIHILVMRGFVFLVPSVASHLLLLNSLRPYLLFIFLFCMSMSTEEI